MKEPTAKGPLYGSKEKNKLNKGGTYEGTYGKKNLI